MPENWSGGTPPVGFDRMICEETLSCFDQVWIVGYPPKITRGMSLSKIDSHWQVGAVQR